MEIQVRNDLNHKSLNYMLSALSGLPNASVLPLGELVMIKTEGNGYFVPQILEVLLIKGLLVQDPHSTLFFQGTISLLLSDDCSLCSLFSIDR